MDFHPPTRLAEAQKANEKPLCEVLHSATGIAATDIATMLRLISSEMDERFDPLLPEHGYVQMWLDQEATRQFRLDQLTNEISTNQ